MSEPKKVVMCVAVLRIAYEPNLDTQSDIEERVKSEFNTLLNRGHLEGCEHGAQIKSWHLEVSAAEVE